MSWNEAILYGGYKAKGLRNKRKKKSVKAIRARLAREAKNIARRPKRFDNDSAFDVGY